MEGGNVCLCVYRCVEIRSEQAGARHSKSVMPKITAEKAEKGMNGERTSRNPREEHR